MSDTKAAVIQLPARAHIVCCQRSRAGDDLRTPQCKCWWACAPSRGINCQASRTPGPAHQRPFFGFQRLNHPSGKESSQCLRVAKMEHRGEKFWRAKARGWFVYLADAVAACWPSVTTHIGMGISTTPCCEWHQIWSAVNSSLTTPL